ncbi:MAG: hypothetical protein ACMXX9_04120 [Candidatus Woesearchaeota archaeon]
MKFIDWLFNKTSEDKYIENVCQLNWFFEKVSELLFFLKKQIDELEKKESDVLDELEKRNLSPAQFEESYYEEIFKHYLPVLKKNVSRNNKYIGNVSGDLLALIKSIKKLHDELESENLDELVRLRRERREEHIFFKRFIDCCEKEGLNDLLADLKKCISNLINHSNTDNYENNVLIIEALLKELHSTLEKLKEKLVKLMNLCRPEIAALNNLEVRLKKKYEEKNIDVTVDNVSIEYYRVFEILKNSDKKELSDENLLSILLLLGKLKKVQFEPCTQQEIEALGLIAHGNQVKFGHNYLFLYKGDFGKGKKYFTIDRDAHLYYLRFNYTENQQTINCYVSSIPSHVDIQIGGHRHKKEDIKGVFDDFLKDIRSSLLVKVDGVSYEFEQQ